VTFDKCKVDEVHHDHIHWALLSVQQKKAHHKLWETLSEDEVGLAMHLAWPKDPRYARFRTDP
jgi:hypothetical protein